MNVRLLHESEGMAQLSIFQSSMHPLWGQDHSALGDFANIRVRVQRTAQRNAQGVGGLRPQRNRNQATGERAVIDWPGRTHGIRAPEAFETPLSWDEVRVALLSIRTALAG